MKDPFIQGREGYYRGHVESAHHQPTDRFEGLEPETEGYARIPREGGHGRSSNEPRDYLSLAG